MNKPTSRLGRGLNALIPPRESRPSVTRAGDPSRDEDQRAEILAIPIDALRPNPSQPRTTFEETSLQELATSIRANGVIQPVLVRSVSTHLPDQPTYELVAGERRWRAAKIAGLTHIPAIVRELSNSQSFEIALIENLQRADLGPLERAAAYQHYLDAFGGTAEDLALKLCESRANVSNYLRLLKLRPEICYMLGAGELGMGHARAIAGVADPGRQLALAHMAVRRNLSVRQVEELARSAGDISAAESDEHAPPSAEAEARRKLFADVEASLTRQAGLRIRVFPGRKKNSGRIVIAYGSLDEFEMIASRLGAKPTLE